VNQGGLHPSEAAFVSIITLRVQNGHWSGGSNLIAWTDVDVGLDIVILDIFITIIDTCSRRY
jgi:hypothetical protein